MHYREDGLQIIGADHPLIGRQTSQDARDLERWIKEEEVARVVREFEPRILAAYVQLGELSARLRATPVAKLVKKRRQTAAMNARYALKKGKRVYVGKRKQEAERLRRAEAEKARRAAKRAEQELMHKYGTENLRLSQCFRGFLYCLAHSQVGHAPQSAELYMEGKRTQAQRISPHPLPLPHNAPLPLAFRPGLERNDVFVRASFCTTNSNQDHNSIEGERHDDKRTLSHHHGHGEPLRR